MNRKIPLVRGFDDYFMAPNSRYTTVSAKAIHDCPQLIVLAESEEAGVLLCMTENGKQIFVMGHLEYDRVTLQKEYERDLAKGFPSNFRSIISGGRSDEKTASAMACPFQQSLQQLAELLRISDNPV